MNELYEIFMKSLPLLFTLAVISISWWNLRLRKRIIALELDREKDRIEQQNCAELRSVTSNKEKYRILHVKNIGKSEARNIRINIDGTSIISVKEFQTYNYAELIGSDSEIMYAFARANPPPKIIELIWDDDFAKDRYWRSSI